MKTIGIKLADGSFYPVIQEGSSEEINLSLTTANNNQTKVIVDLYRSKTNSMEDAEYVDSLQIENLNAHPDGEPDIALSVHLDENNQLHAKIVDSETGAQSNSTVTLVSRTLEQRLNAEDDNTAVAAMATGAAVAGIGLLAAAEALNKEDLPEKDISEENQTIEENPFEEDLSNIENEVPAEPYEPAFDEEISVDIPEEETPDFGETVETAETSELPDFDTPVESGDLPDFEETPASDDMPLEPTMDDFRISEDVPEQEPVAENTNIENEFSENPLEAFGGESNISAQDGENLEDFFGSFDDGADKVAAEDEIADEEIEVPAEETIADEPDFSADETISDETFDNSELPDMDFDLPETAEEDNQLPADFFNMEDQTASEDNFAGGGISFTGLYDKETDFDEPEQNQEKSKVPVIICVTCAIICLIAVALLLFILPTKYNLIQKKQKNAKAQTPVEVVAVETPVETPKVEPIESAKEDEVIIIEKAEEVVPLPPPVKEEKPGNITYKIKWGDTLWDISDTYYKNPWKYKYLARFNGIKDPDYIISGTYIIIPAE